MVRNNHFKRGKRALIRKRSGVGYILEALVAMVTLLVFTVGVSTADQTANWEEFRTEITADDLSYTLKQTGDVESMIKEGETGSLVTGFEHLSGLQVSGTVENLPMKNGLIGVHLPKSEIFKDDIRDLRDNDQCSGDLEEIENQTGNIKRIVDVSERDGETLYFANTSSSTSDGYDALWVDNGTSCQFDSDEGPIYIEEFFEWDEINYELKNISADTNNLHYNNASQTLKIRNTASKRFNEIRSSYNFETFRFSDEIPQKYDLLVIKGSESLKHLNQSMSGRESLEDFLQDRPVLLIANISKEIFEKNDLLQKSGMEWMNLEYKQDPSGAEFGDSEAGEKVQNYFQGSSGDISGLNLLPGANLTSSNSDTIRQQDSMLNSRDGSYKVSDWNSSETSMNTVKPSDRDGYPETSCITDENQASENLTSANFQFPEGNDYTVINTEMGETLTYCDNNDVRAVNIDRNNDGKFDGQEEGPFLSGRITTVANRTYEINAVSSEEVKFIYRGKNRIELANYRTGFEEIRDAEKFVRLPNKKSYNENERILITSVIYWTLEDKYDIGRTNPSITSSSIYGSVEEEIYYPYRLILRWGQ